jgi:hypothetical protein
MWDKELQIKYVDELLSRLSEVRSIVVMKWL